MSKIATIILNRNLPYPTDQLYEHLLNYDGDLTDIYVLEAGSEKKNLSKYCSWHANEPDVVKNGLRYGRGMNYALIKLLNQNRWKEYEGFFLITNDTVLNKSKTIKPLLKVLNIHKKIGILSPCSKNWGEKFLLKKEKTKYFWFIHNNALLLRRNFIENIMEIDKPSYMNFIFDGNNFRGYLSESELIAKAYMNDWAAAITTEVFAEENEYYLLQKSDLIQTESFDENFKLYIDEGKKWIKQKYGFNSHWQMQQYAKFSYDKFFVLNPGLNTFKI